MDEEVFDFSAHSNKDRQERSRKRLSLQKGAKE